MSNYEALKAIALDAKDAGEAPVMHFDQRLQALNAFHAAFTPDVVLGLLAVNSVEDHFEQRLGMVPHGHKLVPVEPTPKQWAAGLKAMNSGIDKVTLVYRAMVAEAPTPDQELL